ncbi:TPA: hypothetical protein HA244_06005 [Candidatus Micrarchaeota archaeon]|nr:hypothetical protein [Candidatus Micrarchaeota archaeon]
MGLDYRKAGVNREARANAKKAISIFKKPRGTIKTPYNDLLPLGDGKSYYLETTDSVGTKVLLTQMAGRHDIAGWEAVACVVNDAIRCGATPKSITNTIEIADSSGREMKQILEGINKACMESGCFVAGGETADVRELVKGVSPNPYMVIASCFGTVPNSKIIRGSGLTQGDVIIGMESSGLHANGISLARKALFRQFDGAYAANESKGKKLLQQCISPTKLYVKPFLALAQEVEVKAAFNVTGDSYLKFDKLSEFNPGLGFDFNFFKPQPIFREIQRAGRVAWDEMFKTFNMGWGFAVVVPQEDENGALKSLKKHGVRSSVIGNVVRGHCISIAFEDAVYRLKC